MNAKEYVKNLHEPSDKFSMNGKDYIKKNKYWKSKRTDRPWFSIWKAYDKRIEKNEDVPDRDIYNTAYISKSKNRVRDNKWTGKIHCIK